MMNPDFVYALLGGALIGFAVSMMLLFNGRVTGISGILGGALVPSAKDWQWRWVFILGLLSGGFILSLFYPARLENTLDTSSLVLIIAGLLVGFGTRLGSGCTSGHGVCGISRFSVRSLVATLVFMIAGILAVVLLRSLGGF